MSRPHYPVSKSATFIQGPKYKFGSHYPGQDWQSCNAIDFGVSSGAYVLAVRDGWIVSDGTGPSVRASSNSNPRHYGWSFYLKDTEGNFWFYTHCTKPEIMVVSKNLRVSRYSGFHVGHKKVFKGQILARVARPTTADMPSHLHLACKHGSPAKLWRNRRGRAVVR